MKTLIRPGVFETNSSSCHSISISSNVPKYETLYPDEDGLLVFNGGQFGWEWKDYYKAKDKCNYVATLIHELSEDYRDDSDNQDAIRLKEKFERVVKDHTGATEILYDLNDVYIDHQSVDSNSGPEIVDLSEQELKDLLFNPDSEISTGNDNE